MKILYWLLCRFGWGFGLVAAPLGLVRDLGTVSLILVFLLGIKLTLLQNVLIGILSFGGLITLGEWLKRRGYLDYATRLGNSVNPELKEIKQQLEVLTECLNKRI